jgi:hypothetical protein
MIEVVYVEMLKRLINWNRYGVFFLLVSSTYQVGMQGNRQDSTVVPLERKREDQWRPLPHQLGAGERNGENNLAVLLTCVSISQSDLIKVGRAL